MGCDIHMVVQKRVPGGKWERVRGNFADGPEPFDWRSYGLFGWLAGVRNYSGIPPLSAPRGLPHDFDTDAEYGSENYMDVGDHSRSWFLVAELLAVDYEQMVEDRRYTRQEGPNFWNGGATCEPGQGETMTLREFLGEAYFQDLRELKRIGADRIVFGFDN